MKKLFLFYVLFALVFVTGCSRDDFDQESLRPVVPEGKANIAISGDGVINTRSTSGKVEFTGGYATGAGLYDGDATAEVQAVPYSGYQLVSFTGGPVDGDLNKFEGSDRYNFPVQRQDWKFNVSFKKEYSITLIAESGGQVTGGGVKVEGDVCAVTASPFMGNQFDGWYEGGSLVSSSDRYSFTVSSNRTIRS
ncbi:InlB B-repeat-containing protein [Bacteroides fragilis]|jgi:hypothetical protein|uniref:InlB B-repeat-containing protein n=1 Tax=Bacteroides fragilis TaxID=817 RepID=UPI000516981F|nr:hypothetical protein [Bacteroides fragilis]MCM0362339.1 hypothetical protein [Bacteroides fragilis]QCQ56848.1 hypothetical protein EC81_024410 [Bacteroides fragilis]